MNFDNKFTEIERLLNLGAIIKVHLRQFKLVNNKLYVKTPTHDWQLSGTPELAKGYINFSNYTVDMSETAEGQLDDIINKR
jgi:hypothetical protein